MSYGLPYKGSKNKLATSIIAALPKHRHLIDLFCGGCAITHAALLSRKYGKVIANDIDGRMPQLFVDAVNGKYMDETRWISRIEFERLKDTDPYVAVCWSFGNDCKTYMYPKEVEPWKRALHYARVFKDPGPFFYMGIDTDGSSNDIIAHHDEYKRKYIKWYLLATGQSTGELDRKISELKDGIAATEDELRNYLLEGLRSSGLTQAEVGRRLGTQMQRHYFGKSQWSFPTREHYDRMRTFMPALDKDYNEVAGMQSLWRSLQGLQGLQSLQRLQGLQYLQKLESQQRLQRLQRLQGLQGLQRLESQQSLQRLEVSSKDYAAVEIPEDSVIYCDIPYADTTGYVCGGFDHERFYGWACRQRVPVFVSSYDMPRDRFECVAEWKHRSIYSATCNNEVAERLFVPKGQKERGCTDAQSHLEF